MSNKKVAVLRTHENYAAVNKAVNDRYGTMHSQNRGWLHSEPVCELNRVSCATLDGFKHPDFEKVTAEEFIRVVNGEKEPDKEQDAITFLKRLGYKITREY